MQLQLGGRADNELDLATDAASAVVLPDPARERRVKALTCTEPLHDLQANRGRRGWDAFDFYELGLAAIDLVVDKMGFDSGIGRDDLATALLPEARRFNETASDGALRGVVDELIETLVRPKIGQYTSQDEVRRRFDFALLTEHEASDGTIYLRATNEAINVLVGGLNTDVESAQVAAEATLEHLIRRGRLNDAARPAREAKIRSIQYAALVQQLIEETRRDVRRAGWRDDAPKRLAEIRDHLKERMKIEQRLVAAMQESRDTAAREDLRRRAAALVEVVDDCFIRHQQLHAMALSSIRVYVEEQDRQVFGRVAAIGAVDLTEEVMLPLLGCEVGGVAEMLTAFAERLLGLGPAENSKSVVPRLQPRFGTFLTGLLRPPPARDQLGPEIVEPEWEEETPDPYAFTQENWEAADGLLQLLDPPRRLAEILADAESEHGFEVADLVRLRTVVAIAPTLDALRPGADPVLAAAADQETFDAGSFRGDNLLVGELTADREAFASAIAAGAVPSPMTGGQMRLLPAMPSPRPDRDGK